MNQYVEKVIDLTNPSDNRLIHIDVEEARRRILKGEPREVLEIAGSFALIAREGITVRMARSLDRPMRYFLAKQVDGPILVVAHRIDTIRDWLRQEGLDGQFHPTYTRMVPAHYIVEILLIGCPDPDPVYTRFLETNPMPLPPNLDSIGEAYIGAVADSIAGWLRGVPEDEPIGVSFSGGIDSGAVFLLTLHQMKALGMNLGRLKAFTLSLDSGPDVEQARQFTQETGTELFLETIDAEPDDIDIGETIRVVEDYKPLDIECASMGLALCRGIRNRYPGWRFLVDGDGGDENLKDYPIEENAELTITSILNNPLLYQEGWGVGRIKHSLTYSGGLSRSYTRTYGPAHHFGFRGFSPFTSPRSLTRLSAFPLRGSPNTMSTDSTH